MGRPDLYLFVVAPGVVAKLRFIHELVRGRPASAEDAKVEAALADALDA